ncbi:MAG: hypothetical protein GC154_04580 [bacterium]|nr:hypothetical protein [bacterium]
MNNHIRRKILEEKLLSAIKRGENQAFKDPEVKKMIQQFRMMYQEDDGGMLSALGMPVDGPPPPNASNDGSPQEIPNLPESKIPQLIFLLDQIGKSQSSSNTKPKVKDLLKKPPAPLSPSSVQGSRKPFLPKADEDLPDLANEATLAGLKAVEEEIEQTRMILARVREDEDAIHERQGTYAVTSTRLKAERLLRELPGKIAYLMNKKIELETQLKK